MRCGVVVVYSLQPSSSVNSGCPGPVSSILVSSRFVLCRLGKRVSSSLMDGGQL